MTQHNVSIVVPVRNAERWLPACIANLSDLLNAAQEESEVVFVDNNSEDRTIELVRSFERSNSGVKIVSAAEIGIVPALNVGLSHARHGWIMRHDVDDYSHPLRISRFREKISQLTSAELEEVAIVASHTVLADTGNHVIGILPTKAGVHSIDSLLQPVNAFIHGSLFLKKSAIEDVGGYRNEFAHIEDVDLWWRLSKMNWKMLGMPSYLYWFRYHRESVSSRNLHIQTASLERLSPVQKDGLWSELDRGVIRQLIWCGRRSEAIRWALQRLTVTIPSKRDLYQICRFLVGIPFDRLRGLMLKKKEREIQEFRDYISTIPL